MWHFLMCYPNMDLQNIFMLLHLAVLMVLNSELLIEVCILMPIYTNKIQWNLHGVILTFISNYSFESERMRKRDHIKIVKLACTHMNQHLK